MDRKTAETSEGNMRFLNLARNAPRRRNSKCLGAYGIKLGLGSPGPYLALLIANRS
jgi:hypothetical protein